MENSIKEAIKEFSSVVDDLFMVIANAQLYAVVDSYDEAEQLARYYNETNIEDEADEYELELDSEDDYEDAVYMAGYEGGYAYVENLELTLKDYSLDDTYTTDEGDEVSLREVLDVYRQWNEENPEG